MVAYIPEHISKMNQQKHQKNREKSYRFLKMFKSLMILSKNIQLIEFMFSVLKDPEIPEFYENLVIDIIDETLYVCIKNESKDRQFGNVMYLFDFFWNENMDNDCWKNIRVLITELIIKKAIKLSSIDNLI